MNFKNAPGFLVTKTFSNKSKPLSLVMLTDTSRVKRMYFGNIIFTVSAAICSICDVLVFNSLWYLFNRLECIVSNLYIHIKHSQLLIKWYNLNPKFLAYNHLIVNKHGLQHTLNVKQSKYYSIVYSTYFSDLTSSWSSGLVCLALEAGFDVTGRYIGSLRSVWTWILYAWQ